MLKIFHEAPNAIFKEVQKHTDGDYALVNLFEGNREYYNYFVEALEMGRTVILDNGVFELGTAWDAEQFVQWVHKLKPTYYIVPDVLEDADATIQSFFSFIKCYPVLPSKRIGVAQGKSYDDLVKCYKAIEPYCDKIAFSFDYSWLVDVVPEIASWATKPYRMLRGRQHMLSEMLKQGIINVNKPHHLLGVMLPQEMTYYAVMQSEGRMLWLDSVDTSNPVVHGLLGIVYGDGGLDSKESRKLYTLINDAVSPQQLNDILYNIDRFRRFCARDVV